MLRLGIDIGGSKIALAGRSDLRTLFTARFAIDDEAMPVAVLSAMAEYLDRQCARQGLRPSISGHRRLRTASRHGQAGLDRSRVGHVADD